VSLRSWLRRRRLDDEDFQEEVRAHLAIAERERMADGADRETARHGALKEFGNVLLTTEAARSVWTPRWVYALQDLASDVRLAVRSLAKNPGFALTVIFVLALGIGANAAVFTMLKGIALTPLAGVDGSARLKVVFGQTSTGRSLRVSYPDYIHIRDHAGVFSSVMGTSYIEVNLGRGRSARQVTGEMVTGNYFQVLGVRAAHGRTLLPSDEVAPGGHPVVVVSHSLFQRDFGADPGIVGQTVEINGYPLRVVGVIEPAFHGTIVSYDVEVFVPVMMAEQIGLTGGLPPASASMMLSDHRAAVLHPHGYLRPDTSLASAAGQLDALWATLSRERPLTDAVQRLRVVPFLEFPGSAQSIALPTLGVLSAMGLLVLLIACANIAGLVLVRGVSRRGEIAVRLALGATRARVVRLLTVENFVLALPGALLGVLLASYGIPVLVAYAEWLAVPQRLFLNVGVDRMVIAFAVLAGCASALVFGFVPAFSSSRVDLVTRINEEASPRGAGRGRLRAGLVIAQVAVSLLLLVGAGLARRSVEEARRANPGFDPGQVTAVALDVKQNAYDEARGRVFYRKLLDAARSEPGIEAATLAEFYPLAFLETRARRVAIEGYEPRRGEDLSLLTNAVASGYFRALRIGFKAGRAFEDRDDERAAPVAVVNETFARRFWGGAPNALGKRLRVGEGDWRTVVGVAADVKYVRIDEAPRPYVYLPFFQAYRSNVLLHTRGAAPMDDLLEQGRALVASLDGDMPIISARPLAEHLSGALIFYDLTAFMLFIFGVAGMALAAMGTYGLVSYAVEQGTREIGIRMALGASGASVVRVFLARGLRLGAIGAALGIAAALGLGWLLGSVLYGVHVTDALSFARALAVVLGGVLLATVVPAFRAARTNPLTALRHQ
jgi:predicted permease